MKHSSKVNIITQATEGVDIAADRYGSIVELNRAFKARLRAEPAPPVVTISLTPPLTKGFTIPRAFKALVGVWEQQGNSAPDLNVKVESDDVADYLLPFLPKNQRMKRDFVKGSWNIRLTASDLLSAETEVIVNASNRELRLGGGVSGAIREAALPSLQIALSRLAAQRNLDDGECVLTGAHGVPRFRAIIHAVAAAGTPEVLRRAILNTLTICRGQSFRSVAFPALGAGAGGMSMPECARVFADVMASPKEPSELRVEICLLKGSDFRMFADTFDARFAG